MEEIAEETGEEPKALQSRPDVFDHLEFIWSAWWDLHGDRPVHWGGAGDIPFSAIDRYAERYGIFDIDAFDRFAELIRAMDQTYRDWSKKRTPTKPKATS